MFTEGPVPMREVMTGLVEKLARIYSWQTREFAVAAARHIRATLLELAEETASASACDERLTWVQVHKSVDALAGEDRELFDLLMYWGMREAEVAALLGVSRGGVRVRWREARLVLREAVRRRVEAR
jgi:DNA-directed RNA polymerase specialized sigma24 family protein